MKAFWKRRSAPLDLETALRQERPAPRPELLKAIARRIEDDGRRATVRAARVAFAGALTVGMLVALSAFGGLGYAASSVTQAVKAAKAVVAPAASKERVAVLRPSSGGDQYRPGYGWGDRNHNHTGPPGLQPAEKPDVKKGPKKSVVVATRVAVDEQARLVISVLGPTGRKLQLVQKGSKVGGKVDGPPTKNLAYVVRVPRTLELALRVPRHLLREGQRYRIRILAKDPSGNMSKLVIPFELDD